MLSLARCSAKRTTLLKPLSSTSRRGFAQATNEPIPAEARQLTDASNAVDGSWKKGKVPVREDHGLWGFFRRKPDGSLKGEEAYETVESPKKEISGELSSLFSFRCISFPGLRDGVWLMRSSIGVEQVVHGEPRSCG